MFRMRVLCFMLFPVILLSVSCDKGTEPKRQQVGPYSFFINDVLNRERLYRYWPVEDSLDTLFLPVQIGDHFAVSAEGKRLYLSVGSQTAVYDVARDSILTTIPVSSAAGIAASLDGKLIALCGEGCKVLRTSDYSVVFSDTTQVEAPTFSADSKRVLAVGGTSHESIYSANVYASAAGSYRFLSSGIHQIEASRDGKYWAIYRYTTSDLSYVLLYSPHLDSIVFAQAVVPGMGTLKFKPDSRTLFYSSPGTLNSTRPGYRGFYELDMGNGHSVREVSTLDLRDQNDSTTLGVPVGGMEVGPDARFLLGLKSQARPIFFAYDLSIEEFTRCYRFYETENYVRPSAVECQSVR